MTSREVAIEIDGVVKSAVFECARKIMAMTVTMPDGLVRSYEAADLYLCLGMVRKDFPNVSFLCKGAKINVYPSRMSSQMAGGVVAYEVRWGKSADKTDMVNIFDYEDKDLTNDINKQADYHQRWLQSLNAGS
ncbi:MULTISPECIES: hypothetical protein [unclassified Pseudomonas]|uniref:hypothetical protein n=1 Tax=unclassified Pseudomonas TaxID=196821 RepID=UPI000CD1A7C0|nr:MULTISPECIES: hypothetical protein [unclassified Pseudomonas]POA10800.1 hypothetical protein C1892_29630 [Pseudomonas sp. MPBD7-1]